MLLLNIDMEMRVLFKIQMKFVLALLPYFFVTSAIIIAKDALNFITLLNVINDVN